MGVSEREIATASVPVEVLPVESARAQQALFRLQVTARSVLGALVLNTGGLVVDHGWLRILGGGSMGLADVAQTNRIGEPGSENPAPGALIVAIDVLGGQFATNGGALPGDPGEVCFFGSDTLRWEPIGRGHSAFVTWVLHGGLADFYGDLRWTGWADETTTLSPDQGLSVYPPLWSAEGRSDIAAASRRACPLTELTTLHFDTAAHLDSPARPPSPEPPSRR